MGTAGWQTFAWCAGILVVIVPLSVSLIQAHDGVLTKTALQSRQALESTCVVDHPHELAQHEDEIFCSGIAECRRTTCQEG